MNFNLDAIRRDLLAAGDGEVFLERARILLTSQGRYQSLPPGERQGRALHDLCQGITPVVRVTDAVLGRVREDLPGPGDRQLIEEHPELFDGAGVPGWLESQSVYAPDWGKLLRLGIGGLVEEVDQHAAAANATGAEAHSRGDFLLGVRTSLLGVSTLLKRYAQVAVELAGRGDLPKTEKDWLLAGAHRCRAVSWMPPRNLHEALQLQAMFHMVLSCLVGGRDVTPGRMDQYLLPWYQRDRADGTLTETQADELLAATTLMLTQLSGNVATDFQSTKRTPSRYSHYYITIGGTHGDGTSAVNELSWAFLRAVRLVQYREPSILVRYFQGIDPAFWRASVAAMRDGLPVLTVNDDVLVPSRVHHGVPLPLAREYAHCACLNGHVPGHDLPPVSTYHNGPQILLETLDEPIGSFDELLHAFRLRIRGELEELARRMTRRRGYYPLVAWPLFEGHLQAGVRYFEEKTTFSDQRLVGLATVVDSLLAIREVVFERKHVMMEELRAAMADNFASRGDLLAFIRRRILAYGQDEPHVLTLIAQISQMWVEEVEQAGAALIPLGIRLIPSFYSWLTNIEMGRQTSATPNGRLAGELLSGDYLPSPGRSRGPTQTLRCMAVLPHSRTLSGGSALPLDPSHFRGEAGLDLLAGMIRAYFHMGGAQLHLVLADRKTLQDAIDHPEHYEDLLVRVTGFSEYFVRLLPEVQRALLERA